ncbi:hypothetical protein [Streptomyces longispororuber]|uniref:hypothetical protein n=1 Tax=Streptomyces longispororuber TaxID=68230 RepID=UPI00210BA8B0|nr:hypothetical protein [Streptomyces longispororuber]MCQ4207573.1 hypothetical protein [Streptomyces longispororuber]
MTVTAAAPQSELDRHYEGLARTHTADFTREEYVHLSNVLSPETIAAYELTITSEVIRLNTQGLPLAEQDTYGKAFLQMTNLWQHHEKVKELDSAARYRPCLTVRKTNTSGTAPSPQRSNATPQCSTTSRR